MENLIIVLGVIAILFGIASWIWFVPRWYKERYPDSPPPL